jgi:hypothetical protein
VELSEYERQRVEHLVLERPRPRPTKVPRRRRGGRRSAASEPMALMPGIEERVALRERWSHKAQGTPETHEHVDTVVRRAGSLARLYATGTIDADQLAAAQEIVETYEAIAAAVSVRSSFTGQRVDAGFRPELAGVEAGGRALRELTYDRWRGAIELPAMVLTMVVDDIGLTIAARRWRVSDRRARAVLVDALEGWVRLRGWRRRGGAIRANQCPSGQCPQ